MKKPTRSAEELHKLAEEKRHKAEVLRRMLMLRDAEDTFIGFVKLLHPEFTLQDFQLDLIEKLERLERGILVQADGKLVTRLLVTMPPRSGKSWLVSWLFPVWYVARNPRRQVLASSYNYELALDFGRRSRDYALNPEVGKAFPSFRLLEQAADLWRTSLGGQYAGVGLQGTTTGRPANLLLVDDPIKNRVEAESPRLRNNTWSFYESALTTRREPLSTFDPKTGKTSHVPAIEVVVLTRWHPDDMAGRLMETLEWQQGMWMHINYPAIRLEKGDKPIRRDQLPPEHPEHIPNEKLPSEKTATYIGKVKGVDTEHVRRVFSPEAFFTPVHEVALWEDRFPLKDLHRRRQQNQREFAALYMQTPYVSGGTMFRERWWRYYGEIPPKEQISAIVVGVDTAITINEKSDFSVLCVVALTTLGDMYVIDVSRGRWEFPDLKRQILLVNARYRGMGLRAFYVEDSNAGKALVQELKRDTHVPVIAHKILFDKKTRAEYVTPLIEGGLVYLPRESPWVDEFLSEVSSFPSGNHDDQVDALVIALDRLAKTPKIDDVLLTAAFSARGSLNSQADEILSRSGNKSLAAIGRDEDAEPHRPFIWGE